VEHGELIGIKICVKISVEKQRVARANV